MNPETSIPSFNPKTKEVLARINQASLEKVSYYYQDARQAQKLWASKNLSERIQILKKVQLNLSRRAEELARLIHLENGKPELEAYTCEILPALELMKYYFKMAPQELAAQPIELSNPLLKYRKSHLEYWPLGSVLVIAPWNYPFFLAFGDVFIGLLTGNAVLFKPSEVTPQVGLFIQALFDESELPRFTLQTLIGDGKLGAELVRAKPDKIFFTGSVATGKHIMRSAADHLTPVVLELGGKDALLVLEDADLDHATSLALWGGYSNSGQACASIERLILPKKIEQSFVELLKNKIAQLRENIDLGVCTFEKQKEVYRRQLEDAKAKGLSFNVGGKMSDDQMRLYPTLVSGDQIEESLIYNEETFGPVIAYTTYSDLNEGIQKVNQSTYGLTACIAAQDLNQAQKVASQLQAGTVMINEALFTAGLSETPWGGIRESGFGRKHSKMGLHEFVHVRHVNAPALGMSLKSPWWFPYTQTQKDFFVNWIKLFEGVSPFKFYRFLVSGLKLFLERRL